MFLRQTRRKKDGKTHSYWSVVENHRLGTGRVVQRHVLYLGEISPSQAAAWRKSIELFDKGAGHSRTLALFPEDRATTAASDNSVVQLRLSEMRLCRARQWGACWLAGQLWSELNSIGSGPIVSRRAVNGHDGARSCKFWYRID
jgi:hypothetical protein